MVMLGGRPVRMPKPAPRAPISQQDVYAMLTGRRDAITEQARQRAAQRAAAVKSVQRRHTLWLAAAEKEHARAREAAERTRFAELFGLPLPSPVAQGQDL